MAIWDFENVPFLQSIVACLMPTSYSFLQLLGIRVTPYSSWTFDIEWSCSFVPHVGLYSLAILQVKLQCILKYCQVIVFPACKGPCHQQISPVAIFIPTSYLNPLSLNLKLQNSFLYFIASLKSVPSTESKQSFPTSPIFLFSN